MIIFDLDGTLWNVLDSTIKSTNYIVSKYNLDKVSIEIVKTGMGLSNEENAKRYFPNVDTKTANLYLQELIDKSIFYIKEDGANIYDRVIDVIKKLSKDYELSIVSNSTNEYIEMFFKQSGLKEYFTNYAGAATYKITKSHAITKVTQNREKEKCVYVGDILKDKIASEEAGIKFIWAKYGFGNKIENCISIDSFYELINVLKKEF